MKQKILTIILMTAVAFVACQWDVEAKKKAERREHNAAPQNPKREFRGAWVHTVNQYGFAERNEAQNKKYLLGELDAMKKAGINVVIFQVRPAADAFYKSDIEPWSRWLVGDDVDGAKDPGWDPLEFMIEEAHKRGMELHAWLNPYRASVSNKPLPKKHPYNKNPERFFNFNNQLYFDPAYEANRDHIVRVVEDIIERYDVDGIHFDDYFYPYPVKGQKIQDDASYAKHGNGKARDDWRRANVDKLIEKIHHKIREKKPWVRFGISPFGIWRNVSSDKEGSETSGLQNYDDLYADVLLWAKNGWIDYQLPQLYWELKHERASSEHLAKWWSNHAYGRHMYFGQDVNRTMDTPDTDPAYNEMNELRHKMDLSRAWPDKVQGNCWWPSTSVTSNYKGVADRLATQYQSKPALVPAYTWLNAEKPDGVKKLHRKHNELTWHAPKKGNRATDATKYVIYKVNSEKTANRDIADGNNIIAITGETSFEIPTNLRRGTVIAVTAVDRVNNESDPATIIL